MTLTALLTEFSFKISIKIKIIFLEARNQTKKTLKNLKKILEELNFKKIHL